MSSIGWQAAAALCFLISGAAALPGPAAHDVTEVAPNVYTFRWQAHRNLFVVTDDGVVVTDPLNPEAASVLASEIRKRTPLPVRYVIYTHEHWDHILGGRVFKDQGAQFVSHAKCLSSFERNPHPDLVQPDVTFDGAAHEIELGGVRVELRYFGPNHGECMTVLRLPREKILHVVDLANPRTVGFRMLPDFEPLQLIRSLREIEQLEFETVVPGHQEPVAPAATIAEQRRYYEDLVEAVRREMEAGVRDPAALTRRIRLPRYEDWYGYEEWLPLNVERVWAYFHMGW